jgi:DNA invertase Pin-like site-specific DNA recombinase
VLKHRCAVYTRKSSEEGLEQEFNSLDAQREACEAYVASQKQEGWVLVPDRYDDGGFSGGTLERPALKRLLADVEAGRVDVIVVYKIDRLSRSLADFMKLVEVFEARNVSFVSVTQSFNTKDSMGRLMLNVLLSFAQFEREVIGERIRDKFAASRRKGLWMGGWAPLIRSGARKLSCANLKLLSPSSGGTHRSSAQKKWTSSRTAPSSWLSCALALRK